jgi:hypothetical protein
VDAASRGEGLALQLAPVGLAFGIALALGGLEDRIPQRSPISASASMVKRSST